ncbi:LLM class flavin-dependent oxidoreductase [Sphingobacterium sp. DR205]|uniref:LLM class flavin-dependent oxidoreductase n=1 Tax=Sphingobacterium sp. DR205 TaxID=2713573 RepID=UPI0013E4E0DE|nr:LLM class flavin-dependent oxidoreductase [Sphingobacterium sp. DR205]QIH36736.1 LLM class flavin-dependent oxidoreductase [Sphingobacterium sp. DR205]
MEKLTLSILELGSFNGVQSIVDDIIPYAQKADKYNFSRFWIGEHYLARSQWYNPDILLPLLAGSTNKISIGTAGILLSYRNVYRTVLDYKMLSSLFPDRIHLGLAKGGIEPEIEGLLAQSTMNDELLISQKFERNFRQLMEYYHYSSEDIKTSPELFIPPIDGRLPELWYLSATLPQEIQDNQLSKLNYCFSFFHTPNLTIQSMAQRIEKLREVYIKRLNILPKISIAFAGACFKSSENIYGKWSIIKKTEPVNSFNEIYGDINLFYEQVKELSYKLNIDDFVFYNKQIEPKQKKQSLKIISKKFDL